MADNRPVAAPLIGRPGRARLRDHPPVRRTIAIHAGAPAKPAEGAACNGCGVCCATAPCPPGVLVTGRLDGPCAALVWREADSIYRCGLVDTPARFLPAVLQRGAPLLGRVARRFIAAGAGCDCDLDVETPAVSG